MKNDEHFTQRFSKSRSVSPHRVQYIASRYSTICTWLVSCLVPRPDIEPNLGAGQHWHSSMNRLSVSFAFSIEVHPKDRTSCSGLESDPFRAVVGAFHVITPFSLSRHGETWKICSATFTIALQVDHERAHPSRVLGGHGPVVVKSIVAADIIALSPEPFDKCFSRPALESESPLFYALNSAVTLDGGLFGLSDTIVDLLNTSVEDSRDVPFLVAGFGQLELDCRSRRLTLAKSDAQIPHCSKSHRRKALAGLLRRCECRSHASDTAGPLMGRPDALPWPWPLGHHS